MAKYLVGYAVTLAVIAALDALWLGVIAKSSYQKAIGHLMADQPNFLVAALFYAFFAAGLMVFAVMPGGSAHDWRKTLIAAALFGFIAYATYDLSNLATLKNWPVGISLVDMAWGTLLSVVSASAGKAAMDRFATV